MAFNVEAERDYGSKDSASDIQKMDALEAGLKQDIDIDIDDDGRWPRRAGAPCFAL